MEHHSPDKSPKEKRLSKEAAFDMLDILEAVADDFIREVEAWESLDNSIISDEESHKEFVRAADQAKGAAEMIGTIRRKVSESLEEEE